MADGCSLVGMATLWDSIPSVRQRLRSGSHLIEEVSSKNVDIRTPSTYNDVLLPVMERMRETERKLPFIDDLKMEIKSLFELNKRDIDEGDLQKISWTIRKQCGFVKMKVRRMEVSIVAWLEPSEFESSFS